MWGPECSAGRFYLQSRAWLQGMYHVRPWALSRSLLSTVWGLATRYVSCEALSAHQVASIYSLGPGYKVCIMWGPERSSGRFYLQSRAWLQGMYHVMPWALSRSLLSTVWGLATRYVSCDALSAQQVASIYSLGPGYKVCIMWCPERSAGRFYLQSRAWLQGMYHVMPWALSRSLLSTV